MAIFGIGDIIEIGILSTATTNGLILDVQESVDEQPAYYIFIILETGRTTRNKVSYIDRISRRVA